ncbi:ATP-binding protein [bacterium]|nr:ATP-binding protein [bacterium]
MNNPVLIERIQSSFSKPRLKGIAALVITGPRATGKTLFAHATFPTHRRVTLALPSEASRALLDPAAFLAAHPPPVVIDDVHLAPRLLHHVSREISSRPMPEASFVLVGTRPLLLEATAREAFGDDTCLVRLDGLSHAESVSARPTMPLVERLLRGGFPALHADPTRDVDEFMRSLVADHLARELPGQLRVDSVHAFEQFLRAAALRSGRLLNKADLAREVGIVGSTAAIWLDTLVEAGIIALVRPWRPAQGRPLVKAPKLYFLDTGLCAHLLGIRSADELATSPRAAALWETYVHGEVCRLAAAAAPPVELVFWRDRTKEADFVVPTPRGLAILDAAWSEFPAAVDIRRLLRIREEIGGDTIAFTAIVCRTPTSQTLRESAGPAVETVGLDDLPELLIPHGAGAG